MIPQVQDDLKQGFTIKEVPSRTFKMNPEREIISGRIDELEAVKQAIYLILSVERYEYLIHSWNYGVELKDLFGQPVSFCLPEIKRRISEALLQDDRITAVDDFDFDVEKGEITAIFTVTTIYGDIAVEKEVVIR